MKVTGYGKQTEWRVSIVTSSTTTTSISSLPTPPSYHTYTLTSLNRDSAYQLEVRLLRLKLEGLVKVNTEKEKNWLKM